MAYILLDLHVRSESIACQGVKALLVKVLWGCLCLAHFLSCACLQVSVPSLQPCIAPGGQHQSLSRQLPKQHSTHMVRVSYAFLCLQVSHPGRQHSDAYDGYEASLSERHSDATSDTTQPEAATQAHKTEGRTLTLSPSIRSSAASTDDLLSPTLTQHLTNGFTNGSHNAVSHQPDVPTDLRSSFNGSTVNYPPAGQQLDPRLSYSGSATPGLVQGGAGLRADWGLFGGPLQAGGGHLGQSLTGGVFACEPHPRALSPELGNPTFPLPVHAIKSHISSQS